jgi:amidohydrolase
VLLRADIDGLPLEEETSLPFRSTHPGKMHACGHDAHAAILLTVADALAGGSVPFQGTAVLFFQPAEEGPGGCQAVLKTGLLERYPVRRAFALHVWPGLPVGSVGLSEGPVMAGMDHVRCLFKGRGGHGAYPQQCVSPLLLAAETLLRFGDAVPKGADLPDSGVLSFGRVQGGTAPNIIPETAEAEGTLRWLRPEVRHRIREAAVRIAAEVASQRGGSASLTITDGAPPTVNHPAAYGELRPELVALFGEGSVIPATPTMGAEDMSLILQKVPGCYLRLGAGSKECDGEPLHSPRFVPDEGCLVHGVAATLAAVIAFGV